MINKNILITGATSGIGGALVDRFSLNGDNVIACGRNEVQLNALSDKVMQTCSFDMTDPSAIENEALKVGELDVLVLNAGTCLYIDVDDEKNFNGNTFQEVINTNLTSLGWLLAYFLPKVKEGGQVVFISSSATIVPFPRSEAYGASKAGMDYLAKSLRLDLAKHNIGVSLVHPGFIKTPLTDKNDFSMPFLLTSEEAANRIFKGILAKKRYIHFPKRLTLLLKLFSFFPSSLWQAMLTRNNNQ